MNVEIRINGPGYIIKSLKDPIKSYSPDAFITFNDDEARSCLIISSEGDEEAIDLLLKKIEAFVVATEKANNGDVLDILVRDRHDSEEPLGDKSFSPAPGLTIEPWQPASSLNRRGGTILLDANDAFGVGTHPTTNLCLNMLTWLQDFPQSTTSLQGSSVLDIGTGSGILAMSAVELGAARALGVEIDRQAARSATLNVAHNNMAERVEIRQGSLESVDEQFDLVLANLVISVLLPMCKKIAAHLLPGGLAIISGFGPQQKKRLCEAFFQHGLQFIDMKTKTGWSALLLEKPI